MRASVLWDNLYLRLSIRVGGQDFVPSPRTNAKLQNVSTNFKNQTTLTRFTLISTIALGLTIFFTLIGQTVIAWLLFLTYYVYWLIRKKPLNRTAQYDFELCKFSITIKRW